MPRNKDIPAAGQFEWESEEEKARVMANRPPGVSVSNYLRSLMGLPPLQRGRRKLTPAEMREKLKDSTLDLSRRNYYRAALRGLCPSCDGTPAEGQRFCATCAATKNERVRRHNEQCQII